MTHDIAKNRHLLLYRQLGIKHIYEAFIKCYRVHGDKELSGRVLVFDTFLVSLNSTRVLFTSLNAF